MSIPFERYLFLPGPAFAVVLAATTHHSRHICAPKHHAQGLEKNCNQKLEQNRVWALAGRKKIVGHGVSDRRELLQYALGVWTSEGENGKHDCRLGRSHWANHPIRLRASVRAGSSLGQIGSFGVNVACESIRSSASFAV